MPPAACYACAHRGLASEATENTIAAFQAAAAAGFLAVELDLRVTRDGEVVVLHDASLARTTDGSTRVADIRYDELRTYRTPDGPVPRLDDLFASMRGWKGVWNLEVKATAATEPMLELVRHHGLQERVLVSSFDARALGAARDHMPQVPRAYITMGEVAAEETAVAKDLGCTWMNVSHADLDAATVRSLRDHGLRVGAWTVNDPAAALALRERGVACVITDVRAVREALGDVKPFV